MTKTMENNLKYRSRRYETFIKTVHSDDFGAVYYTEEHEEIIQEIHNYTEDKDVMEEREYTSITIAEVHRGYSISWFDRTDCWGYR